MDISTVKQAPVQPSQPPKRAEPVRQTEVNEKPNRAQEEVKPASAPKPSPVVNSQGQVTGRLVNTTA